MTDNENEFMDKKPKNPLDSLPKSAMSLDACKRLYNENKLTDKNFFYTQFPTMFDKDGFSLYKSLYKYSDDLVGRPDFVNKNFMRGIVQRMDDSRKYLFACLVLYEDTKELVGYWIMRGSQPIVEVFEEFLDDNTWEKMEPNEESFKELNQAFYEDEISSRKINKMILI